MANSQQTPWKDGYYKISTRNTHLFKITGESVEIFTMQGITVEEESKGKWKYGEFGKAHPELLKYTGKSNYNVQISMRNGIWDMKGILSDDREKISIWYLNEVANLEWMTEDKYMSMKNSGDPADAPPSHYKIQPEYDGKLVFISGPPGLGKSTSGLLLSKVAGYVYYEADGFIMHVNPYIPPDVKEPSLATLKQKPLIGLTKERINAVKDGMSNAIKMFRGEEYDKSKIKAYYTELCKDINAEKKRLGGDWVVAHAVPKRFYRDYIKKQLGPKAVFILLSMSKEDQIDRLNKRHGNEKSATDWLGKMYDIFEPATEDEERAINIQVTKSMSREDVVQMIIDNIPY